MAALGIPPAAIRKPCMTGASEMMLLTGTPRSPSRRSPSGLWQSARMAHLKTKLSRRRIAVGTVPNTGMVRVITALAALAALTTAAVVPVSWFFAAEARLQGEAEIRAQIYLIEVAQEAQQNPTFWNALAGNASDPVLASLDIARTPDTSASNGVAERRRVFSAGGQMVIDTATAAKLAWPLFAARLSVMDRTTRIGEVEIARSLRPALLVTAGIAGGSAALGILIFLLLRVIPLRMLEAAIKHASYLSAHDPLTGLPNRRLFHDRLEQALACADRDRVRIAVFYMDLDRFKKINDLLGHAAGDATLRIVAERLRSGLRSSDTLARLGGDEFAVIQPVCRRIEDAGILGRHLLDVIAAPLNLDGKRRSIGLSVGIAISEIGVPEQAEQLMKQADQALYRAKQEGRGRVCFFTADMNERIQERLAMETDLRVAVAEQHLRLHYQSQVSLATGRLLGAEALLRWDRPDHGIVPPDQFISLAEDTGLIVPIGIWVLREACRQASAWPEHIGVAVNVSPVQFRHPGFCEAVIDAIRDTGITPSRLELEITEGILLQDTEETLTTLRRLRELGARLAMDDFGTGYSSLGYLLKFRFDKIKIDRSFISRLGQDDHADAIVRAVILMAEALGACSTAEGVETSTQARVLRTQGCVEAQGYLYSRPVSGEAFDTLLRQDQVRSRSDAGELAVDFIAS